ncbi:helix-turn-helix domain-containing protein [Nocardia sp. IFM 10818]
MSTEYCWTIEDVGRFLKVSPDTIREWRKKRYGPPAKKAGKHLRYKPAQVVEWFDNLPADDFVA